MSPDWLRRVRVVGSAMMIVAPDRREVMAFNDIRVNHPAERTRMKIAVHRITRGLGRDRTLGAEYRMAIALLGPARLFAFLRDAPVHMLVPLRDAQRNAFVETLELRILWHRVHRADEMQRAVVAALVEDRRRFRSVEVKCGEKRATIVREVVDPLLLHVWEKHLVSVGGRGGGV